MKKTILTSIAAIAFAMPAIAANIPNDATCNSGVLGVSSGSANLEADYTANTINITWDGNGGSTPTGGATSCTYDSTFNLPTAPTKTGYTFAGWAVQAAQSCSQSMLRIITEEHNGSLQTYNNIYTNGLNGTWSFDVVELNWNEEQEVVTNYFNLAGISRCISGACSCAMTKYTLDGNAQCEADTIQWVGFDTTDQDYCSQTCAEQCSFYMFDRWDSFM